MSETKQSRKWTSETGLYFLMPISAYLGLLLRLPCCFRITTSLSQTEVVDGLQRCGAETAGSTFRERLAPTKPSISLHSLRFGEVFPSLQFLVRRCPVASPYLEKLFSNNAACVVVQHCLTANHGGSSDFVKCACCACFASSYQHSCSRPCATNPSRRDHCH